MKRVAVHLLVVLRVAGTAFRNFDESRFDMSIKDGFW
jgi:hypothetical protein